MSPIIEFSDKDMLRAKIVTPAYYRVRIDSTGQSMAANGQSMNYPMEGTIVCNADDGSQEFAGVPTPASWNFNSKAKGFMIDYFKAFDIDVTTGTRYELANTVGQFVDMFIGNDLYQGRTVNKVTHQYRKPRNL